jgi:hypothetical protein
VIGVVEIIQHVDAAAERNQPVDHAQLAMQAAPAAQPEHSEPPDRRVHTPLDAGAGEALAPFSRKRPAAEAVDHHLDGHATKARPFQRQRDLDALAGEVEDVGLELHFARSPLDGSHQRGEPFAAALEQPHLMAAAGGRERVGHGA